MTYVSFNTHPSTNTNDNQLVLALMTKQKRDHQSNNITTLPSSNRRSIKQWDLSKIKASSYE